VNPSVTDSLPWWVWLLWVCLFTGGCVACYLIGFSSGRDSVLYPQEHDEESAPLRTTSRPITGAPLTGRIVTVARPWECHCGLAQYRVGQRIAFRLHVECRRCGEKHTFTEET
jgi:hypothetical protein